MGENTYFIYDIFALDLKLNIFKYFNYILKLLFSGSGYIGTVEPKGFALKVLLDSQLFLEEMLEIRDHIV